jgi:hydrogenase maturation protease
LSRKTKILVFGYGNPGRQDDGMGVLLVDELYKWAAEYNINYISTDSNYQLNLEDAATVSEYGIIVFADASKEEIENYTFTELKPSAAVDFTMHSVSPGFILHLCGEIFHRQPRAYLLHIKGYSWEFMADPTPEAMKNLKEATDFLKDFILNSAG